MCLYHYLYFWPCQHGELTLITYCDEAKALGLSKRDSLSRRRLDARTGFSKQINTRSLSQPIISSSASRHSASDFNMTTLSPSRVRSAPGCSSVAVSAAQSSPSGAALVPRSALPDPGPQGTIHDSPHTASMKAVHHLEAFNTDVSREQPLSFSTTGSSHGSPYEAVSTGNSAHHPCDSDADSTHDSSGSSVEIITNNSPVLNEDVKLASPRKSIPTQWMPPSRFATIATVQETRTHGAVKGSPSGSASNNKTVRATRSSVDLAKSQAGGASFLTKEALDAVNANIIELGSSPSKSQRSPTKAPWKSPTVSPKVGSARQHPNLPSEPPSPLKSQIGAHVTSSHKRASSSIASTGATSFFTAHGSPVRSYACSQSSCSSGEEVFDDTCSVFSNDEADVEIVQNDESTSKSKSGSVQAAKVKPELSISIPPMGTALTADRVSPSNSSRIPRMSSKISSARAPTLSSTLKQTKSTQTLRSPKAASGSTESNNPSNTKISVPRSLRHVRTVDSAGSTPILSDRKGRGLGITRAVASNARNSSALCFDAHRNTEPHVSDAVGGLPASSTSSRATSASTVKATQTSWSLAKEGPGDMHSSDADDEHDDSALSVSCSENGPQMSSDDDRDSNMARCASVGHMAVRPGLVSELRATAREFVPAQDVSAPSRLPDTLPDMFALDGYGIPWFYHMYPVPCLLPPMYARGRSKSPKKLRPKKQRSTPMHFERTECGTAPPVGNAAMVGNTASHAGAPTNDSVFTSAKQHDDIAGAEETSGQLRPSGGPFAAQLDEIARQTLIQTSRGKRSPSHEDLTAIRNVVEHDDSQHHKMRSFHTGTTRLRNTRHSDNGLYGGRGNVGVPLHATVPFPDPIAPKGRPAEPLVGYTVGTSACGTIQIEKAFEYDGGHACNSCEPRH